MEAGIINNRDFYRKIVFTLDEPKLRMRFGELEEKIKKVKWELDKLEREKSRVLYDLSDDYIFNVEGIQLVNTSILSPDDASDIQHRISGEFRVSVAVSKFGLFDLYCGCVPAPVGKYYVFGNRWSMVKQRIYAHNGDVPAYHASIATHEIGVCYNCDNFNCEITTIGFCDPGNGYMIKQFCERCAAGKNGIQKYDRRVQVLYNKDMRFHEILTLLLYARSREPAAAIHKDSFPLDLFKVILRLVFPSAFLIIK